MISHLIHHHFQQYTRLHRILNIIKTLINIQKEKHKGNDDRGSGFISDKALVSLCKNTCVFI